MADAKMLKKVPVREQDPKVRATNFEEVCLDGAGCTFRLVVLFRKVSIGI